MRTVLPELVVTSDGDPARAERGEAPRAERGRVSPAAGPPPGVGMD